MRINATRFLLVATLAIVPAAAFAAAPPAKAPAKATTSHSTATKPATSEHATTGVVKSVNTTALTITRSGKEAGEMSFVVNSTTKRDGKIEVGAPVSVRYHENGASHVATAISAQHAKPQSTSKKP